MSKVFEVTAPDGHVLEVTGPADATEEQALQQAQLLYQPKQASPQELLQQQASAIAQRPKTLQPLLEAQQRQLKEIGPGLAKGAVGIGLGEGAGALLGPVISKLIPSALRTSSGKLFDQLLAAGKDIPAETTAPMAAVTRAEELRQAGSTMPKVLRDFAKAQATAESTGEPLTYGTLRDFQSAASKLSARESQAMTGPMGRQVREFAQALKTSNREAMAKIGLGDVFDQAMKDYARASSIEGATEIAKKWIARAAITAALGSAGGAGYELFNYLRGR